MFPLVSHFKAFWHTVTEKCEQICYFRGYLDVKKKTIISRWYIDILITSCWFITISNLDDHRQYRESRKCKQFHRNSLEVSSINLLHQSVLIDDLVEMWILHMLMLHFEDLMVSMTFCLRFSPYLLGTRSSTTYSVLIQSSPGDGKDKDYRTSILSTINRLSQKMIIVQGSS